MTTLVEYLIWIPTIALLGYTIPACYFDIKYREVPEKFWQPLAVVGIPVTALLYLLGYYPLYLLVLSVSAMFVYTAFFAKDFYQGADYLFLLAIAAFLVQNPVSGNILMPISFGIFLLASVVGVGIIYQTWRAVTKAKHGESYDMANVRFPFMLQISLALWLTVAIA